MANFLKNMKIYLILIPLILGFFSFVPSLFASYSHIIFEKDLGYGITLSQTKWITYLHYQGKKIQSQSNLSSENPFVWDEWCEELATRLEQLSNDSMDSSVNQSIWNQMWSEKQASCMREWYQKIYSVSILENNVPSQNRFLLIHKANYEWEIIYIFDTKTKTWIGSGVSHIMPRQVQIWLNATYVLGDIVRGWSDDGIIIFSKAGEEIGNFDSSSLEKITGEKTDNLYISTFELLPKKTVKVTYALSPWSKKKIFLWKPFQQKL